ncbi:MAG: WG repeat-containing protein [Paracoccaceae bacterium]
MSDLPQPFPAQYGREWPQKMGFIDNIGKVVIPQDFDFSHHSKFSSSGYAWVKQANQHFVIDTTGQMVFEMPSDMFNLWYVPPDDAGIFPVEHRLDHKSPWAYVQDGRDRVYRGRSKYYAMDLNGDIRFEGYITNALHGHYIFQDAPGLNAPKGIMNRDGDVVVPAALNWTSTSKSEPYLSVMRDGRFGVIDFQGNEVLPINKSVKHWSDFSRVENGLVQYFDRVTQMCPSQTITGEIVGQLPPNHWMKGPTCPTISDGLALLHWERHDGDAVYVDAYGRYMLGENEKPTVFAPDIRMGFFYEGLASMRQDDKTGFIDKTGAVVIPREFYGASDFSGGLARVTDSHDDYRNQRYCYVNRKGEIVAKNH